MCPDAHPFAFARRSRCCAKEVSPHCLTMHSPKHRLRSCCRAFVQCRLKSNIQQSSFSNLRCLSTNEPWPSYEDMDSLIVSTVLPGGEYGPMDICPKNSVVVGVRQKVKTYRGFLVPSGIHLLCNDPGSDFDRPIYLASQEAWDVQPTKFAKCPEGESIVGFKLREDMDGLEEVVQALDFVCSDGLVLPAYEDDDPRDLERLRTKKCKRGKAICGLMTAMEFDLLVMSEVSFYCCPDKKTRGQQVAGATLPHRLLDGGTKEQGQSEEAHQGNDQGQHPGQSTTQRTRATTDRGGELPFPAEGWGRSSEDKVWGNQQVPEESGKQGTEPEHAPGQADVMYELMQECQKCQTDVQEKLDYQETELLRQAQALKRKKQEIAQRKTELDKEQRDLDHQKQAINQTKIEIAEKQRELDRQEKGLQSEVRDLDRRTQAINDTQEEVAEKQQELDQQEQELQDQLRNLDYRKHAINQTHKEIAEEQQELKQQEQGLRLQELDLERRKQGLDQHQTNITKRQHELDQLEQDLQLKEQELECMSQGKHQNQTISAERQQGLHQQEQELLGMKQDMEQRQREMDRQQRELKQQQRKMDQQEGDLEQRHRQMDHQEGQFKQRQQHMNRQQRDLKQRQQKINWQERDLEQQQRKINRQERGLKQRQQKMDQQEGDLKQCHQQMDHQERQFKQRQQHMNRQQRDLKQRQRKINQQERDLEQRQRKINRQDRGLKQQQRKMDQQEGNLKQRHRQMDHQERQLEQQQQQMNQQERDLEQRQRKINQQERGLEQWQRRMDRMLQHLRQGTERVYQDREHKEEGDGQRQKVLEQAPEVRQLFPLKKDHQFPEDGLPGRRTGTEAENEEGGEKTQQDSEAPVATMRMDQSEYQRRIKSREHLQIDERAQYLHDLREVDESRRSKQALDLTVANFLCSHKETTIFQLSEYEGCFLHKDQSLSVQYP